MPCHLLGCSCRWSPAAPAQGFEECPTVAATFKLFDSFDGLLERDAIGAELERKHAELVRSFLLELREVRLLV